MFRPSSGVWYTFNLVNSQVVTVQFGLSGDKPQIGDFDGDGKNDYAVFRPSNATWYFLKSTAGFSSFQFGLSDDIPAPADFDGDHQTDIAVFRPSAATWYVQKSTTGFSSFQFGLSEDIPAQADYDGDGKADYAVYRPSNRVWYRTNSSNNAFVAIFFGDNGDIPIPSFRIVQ